MTRQAVLDLHPKPSRPSGPRRVGLCIWSPVTRFDMRSTPAASSRASGCRRPQQISRQMKVSLVTAHRALGELVGDGVLNRKQGRGTFVRRSCRATRPSARPAASAWSSTARAPRPTTSTGSVLEGVRQAARAAHLDLVLLRFGDDLRGRVRRVSLGQPAARRGRDNRCEQSAKRPCVVAGAGVGATRRPCRRSTSTTSALAAEAARHLLDLGHRRLGYVGGGTDRQRRATPATVASASATPAWLAAWTLDDDHVIATPRAGGSTTSSATRLVAMLRPRTSADSGFRRRLLPRLIVYAAATQGRAWRCPERPERRRRR